MNVLNSSARRPRGYRILFISWARHSRPRDLSTRLSAEYFIPARFALRWWWPLRYTVQAVATVVTIVRRRPSIVLGSVLTRSRCWADCHSGAYNDPRWQRFSKANRAVVHACDGAIFHNDILAAEQAGAVRRTVVVSVSSMACRVLPRAGTSVSSSGHAEPLALVVCSYGFDEPLDVVFMAAQRLRGAEIALTGDPPADIQLAAPGEVRFTGWLSGQDYAAALDQASVVVCLTTREATMQNGVIEALEHCRPVITSETQALRSWAADVPGVITTANEPEALARTIQTVVQDRDQWLALAREGHQVAARRAEQELARLRSAFADS
jgi:glycosyltransferase involved in cell wall biosynthesis